MVIWTESAARFLYKPAIYQDNAGENNTPRVCYPVCAARFADSQIKRTV